MILGPDYRRPVRTLTGTTQTSTIKFTWDRSESMKRLHETGTDFRSVSIQMLVSVYMKPVWKIISDRSDWSCLYGSPLWLQTGPSQIVSVQQQEWVKPASDRLHVQCKQKQAFVWRPIWSHTGLSLYRSHVIRALVLSCACTSVMNKIRRPWHYSIQCTHTSHLERRIMLCKLSYDDEDPATNDSPQKQSMSDWGK